jgi:hypothetical protein
LSRFIELLPALIPSRLSLKVSNINMSFRDFLAPELIAQIDKAQGPVPLFSPTQLPLLEKMQRSAPSSSHVRDESTSSDKENRAPTAPTFQTAVPIIAPMPQATRYQQLPLQSHRVKQPVLSPIDEDTFFSPAQSSGSYNEQFTPNVIQATPYKTLPKLEMLRLDYIQQCSSQEILQEIVGVLQDDPRTPSLLRAAKSRMGELASTTIGPLNLYERSMMATSEAPSSTAESSSLFFSVDSDSQIQDDKDEEESIAPQPLSPVRVRPHHISQAYASRAAVVKKVNTSKPKVMSKIEHQVVFSAVRNDSSSFIRKHNKLYAEIEHLTQQLKNMETSRWHEQQDFWEQMQELRLAKETTEREVYDLRKQVKATGQSRPELVKAVEQLTNEKKQLEDNFLKQQQAWVLRNQEQQTLQNKLHARIQVLSTMLQAVQSTEGILQHENQDLNRLLTNAQCNLLDVKQERDYMLQMIVGFSGDHSGAQLDFGKLTLTERKEILRDFQTHIAASNVALQALAGTVKTAEADRGRVLKSYHKTYALWKQSDDKCKRLERDNKDLTKEINQLSQELAQSQAYTDTILQSTNVQQKKHWEDMELRYQERIKTLKSQVTSQRSKVPVGLYRSAVLEAKTNAMEAERHRRELEALNAKVAKIQREYVMSSPGKSALTLIGAAKAPKSVLKTPKTPLAVSTVKKRVRLNIYTPQVEAEASCLGTPNYQLMTPKRPFSENSENSLGMELLSSNSKARKETLGLRRQMVLRSGGLKALKEQYKKARSPMSSAAKRTPFATLK